MNERQPYEQHLADKMQQLPPPLESDKAWEQMKVLLDKELPRGNGTGGNGRWWIIGMIAGILLTGTWFISQQNNSGEATAAKKPTAVDKSLNATDAGQESITKLPPVQHPPGAASRNDAEPGQISGDGSTPTPSPAAKSGVVKADPDSQQATGHIPSGKNKSRANADAARTERAIVSAKEPESADDRSSADPVKTDDDVGRNIPPFINRTNHNKLPAYTENSTQQSKTRKENTTKGIDPAPANGTSISDAPGGSTPGQISDHPLPIETDQLLPAQQISQQYAGNHSLFGQQAIAIKNSAPKKSPRKTDRSERAFAIGLSLPLAFPLADQQALGYNFRGGANTVSDYIPSPHAQYHLNKRTFFQTELQVIAPQYIRPILLYQQKNMTSGNSWLYNSVYARKLYYFNLPVSVYHSPLPNFFLGTGLQFSSLMSGVAMYENKKVTGNQEMVLSQSFNRIDHDSLTNRMNGSEMRLLIDVNYYWQKFTVGLRYNQAFGNSASFRLNNTTGYTYDKNKALFFYLRYNIWEDKKRKLPARSMLTLK